jgi:hypothetical protein
MQYKIKQIKNHEGYLVDTNGIIYSCWRRRYVKGKTGTHKVLTKERKPLSPTIYSCGYMYVNLGTNKKAFRLHRLIAQSFLENPENKNHVAHIDGNRLNNRVENLRWSTAKENEADKKRHGRAVFNIIKYNQKKQQEARQVID